MYSIIQFEDGGTVALVDTRWMSPCKREVQWPPIKDAKTLYKMMQNGLSPQSGWKTYGVNRVFLETATNQAFAFRKYHDPFTTMVFSSRYFVEYNGGSRFLDDLEKAKKKLKLVEDTSDLQTEEEDPSLRPKRKVFSKRSKNLFSSDEETDAEIEKFSRPPLLTKQYASNIECLGSDKNKNGSKSDHTERAPTSSESEPLPLREIDYTESAPTNSKSQTRLHEIDAIGIRHLAAARSDSGSSVNQTAFHETIISLLSEIKIQNETLIALMKDRCQKPIKLHEEFAFPCKIVEEVINTEEILRDKNKCDNLVSYLKSLGGRDAQDKTSRILKHLISDNVASQFNFFGKRSNKRPFSSLRLRSCITEAVKETTRKTDKEIEDIIKVWLKHAPERMKIKEKNQAKLVIP